MGAMHGDTEVVVALLTDERFTEVNAVDSQGRTALHRVAASAEDYSVTAKAILNSDRFVMQQAKDRKNRTALDTAVENTNAETAKVLKTCETGLPCAVSVS